MSYIRAKSCVLRLRPLTGISASLTRSAYWAVGSEGFCLRPLTGISASLTSFTPFPPPIEVKSLRPLTGISASLTEDIFIRDNGPWVAVSVPLRGLVLL